MRITIIGGVLLITIGAIALYLRQRKCTGFDDCEECKEFEGE